MSSSSSSSAMITRGNLDLADFLNAKESDIWKSTSFGRQLWDTTIAPCLSFGMSRENVLGDLLIKLLFKEGSNIPSGRGLNWNCLSRGTSGTCDMCGVTHSLSETIKLDGKKISLGSKCAKQLRALSDLLRYVVVCRNSKSDLKSTRSTFDNYIKLCQNARGLDAAASGKRNRYTKEERLAIANSVEIGESDDDVRSDDSDDDTDEQGNKRLRTQSGYVKDGFVVDDDDEEEEEVQIISSPPPLSRNSPRESFSASQLYILLKKSEALVARQDEIISKQQDEITSIKSSLKKAINTLTRFSS